MSDQPTVSINGVSHTVLCGLCKAPVTFRAELDPDSADIGCAACGNWDNPDKVAKIAFEYAKDEGQMMLNRLARDFARQSKFMTFSGETKSDKSYRFTVANLKF